MRKMEVYICTIIIQTVNRVSPWLRKVVAIGKKPRNVSIPYFVNKSEHQSGCVASNGQVMLLSLQSYGSMGAEDIYVSFKNRDKWTEPRNIGSVVNTKFQEMTPVLAKDNKTLFFSSNGHSGAGSMDIFRTTRLDDTWLNWSRPENVKEVNSSGREHSFSYDPASNLAQFVTTQDSDGYGDIRYKELEQPIEIDTAFLYVMREPTRVSSSADGITITVSIEDPKTLLLHGLITDKKSKAPIKANLTLTSVNNNSAFNITSDSVSGAYNAVIKSKGKYRVKIEAKGYLTHMEELDINADIVDDPGINYSLDPIKVGEAIKLEHVLFERGTINLLPSSYDDLDGVVELLKDNPTMEIELAGHTDNQGSSKLNMKLSQDRVDVVKKYMVKKGVASRRITGKGYGGTRPVASNKNPVTRKLNRRVEFILVKE